MKRYAIVRVEKECPKDNSKALQRRCLNSDFQCKDCYGDTKEQLIRKIATAIKRVNFLPREVDRDLTEWDYAERIVKYLGVEDR